MVNGFQELIENLEENKEDILLDKERIKELKEEKRKKFSKKEEIYVDIFEDRVEYQIEGTVFIFDRESYDLFEEKFNTFRSKIIVYKGEKDQSEGYLCKLIPGLKKPLAFHRWLMLEEIEKFALKNNIENKKTIHIHHLDCDTTNNRKGNLQVMTCGAHKKLHNRLPK